MNFLRGHGILTEVLYDCLNFSFVNFLSLTHPSPVCSEFLLKSITLKFYSFYHVPKMLNEIIRIFHECPCRIKKSHRGVGILTRDELAESLVEIPTPLVRFPYLHGPAHDGLFFFHLDCGYPLEYPQSMFSSKNKKNNIYPCKPQFYYRKVWFKGVKIIYTFSG